MADLKKTEPNRNEPVALPTWPDEVYRVLKEADGHVRVSLRSLGHVDVSVVAALFGGGGHRFAAGFTTTDPVPRVVETILRAL